VINYLYKPRLINNSESIYYILRPGYTAQRVSYDLAKLKLTKYPKILMVVIFMEGRVGLLKSGEYELPPGVSLQKAIDKLYRGQVAKHYFTIVDGWTFIQLYRKLQRNPFLQHQLQGLTPAEISVKLNLTQKNPEGFFLPETYQFIWPDSDLDILQRAHKALITILENEWEKRKTGNLYKTSYQALIAASLIQKESSNIAERNKISGVIYRRLSKNMRLQIDPTIIYALGEKYTGKLHHTDLRIDSPYNTYRYYGLPPTPIALPGANAIFAALNPDNDNELYFVAIGNGTHYFSSTLAMHNRAVTTYLRNDKKLGVR
jgi:UPF0755 protein